MLGLHGEFLSTIQDHFKIFQVPWLFSQRAWCKLTGLTDRFAREIEAVKTQYPFEDRDMLLRPGPVLVSWLAGYISRCFWGVMRSSQEQSHAAQDRLFWNLQGARSQLQNSGRSLWIPWRVPIIFSEIYHILPRPFRRIWSGNIPASGLSAAGWLSKCICCAWRRVWNDELAPSRSKYWH